MTQQGLRQRFYLTVALSLLAVALWVLMADPALAQGAGTTGNFSCSDGTASGKLYNLNASCPTSIIVTTDGKTEYKIFSYLVCNIEQLSSNLMGSMYCGMIKALQPMVIAVLTLAVLFFGMGFTMGVIPATAREFQKFLLKIAFITVFATQSEYLIGVGYRILVEGAREGINIAMSGIYKDGANGGSTTEALYKYLDNFLATTLKYASTAVGMKWDVAGGSNPCKNAIFAVLAIMAVAFPPLFYVSLLIIVKVALTFIRGVFGYCYAIVGITFLLTLAPFFLSFYLFQQTRAFFDKWLGYLVSFSLQMMIVFAFLSFVVSIDVNNIAKGIMAVVVPAQEVKETTAMRLPWKYCTLCQFEVLDKDKNVIPDGQYKGLTDGSLRCKPNPNYSTTATEPKNRVNYLPIEVLGAISPSDGKVPDKTIQNMLLKFTGTGLISLLVLAYIVDAILSSIPSLAQRLAGGMGGTYAPQLGGGRSPYGTATIDIPGASPDGMLGTFERGFYRGYSTTPGTVDNSVSRFGEGIRQGFNLMATGKYSASDKTTSADTMTDRLVKFLVNPLRDRND